MRSYKFELCDANDARIQAHRDVWQLLRPGDREMLVYRGCQSERSEPHWDHPAGT